jgi:Uma2 family endonuclease
MATIASEPMTAETFLTWCARPENEGRRFELDQGEIIPMPPPNELHGAICALVSYILTGYLFRLGRGHVCTNDTGLIVSRDPDTVRGPDLMLFLDDRPLGQLSRANVERLPALVVEVLSPSGRVNQRISQYLRLGVPLVWLVDPEERMVTVYRPGREMQVFDESHELTGDDVLPEFRCRVADLFALPGRSATPGGSSA